MYKGEFLKAVLAINIFLSACSSNQVDVVTEKLDHPSYVEFEDSRHVSESWSKENILVFQVNNDPVNLHPANVVNITAYTIQKILQGYLLMVDLQRVDIIPGMVKSMPAVSPDQLSYSFELHEEATWDNGTPVTAEDVIFTMKAHKCKLTKNPQLRPGVENLEYVTADQTNPRKFMIKMKSVHIHNKSYLCDIPIMSRAFFDPENILSHYSFEQFNDPEFLADTISELQKWSVEFNDGKYGNDPKKFFGAGAYKVTSWDRESSITLERKENHWTHKISSASKYLNSFPEKIVVKIEKDETAIKLDLKSQVIDVTTSLPTKVLLELQQDSAFNKNYNSAFIQSYSANFIVLNTRPDGSSHKRIFDDLKVRRAIAMLTPVDQIIDVLIMSKAVRWPCFVSPLMTEYNGDLKLIPLDIAGAKKILNEAGWSDTDQDGVLDKKIDGVNQSLEVEFLYGAQGNLSANLVNMVVESAAKAGVKINPKGVEMGILQQNLSQHQFDMAMTGWTSGAFIKDYSQLWGTQSWASGGSNYSGFGNADSDALIDSMKYMMNDSLRNLMSKRLQKMIYDQQPCVFMYSTFRKVAMHKRWGNQIASAESPTLILNNMKLISQKGGAGL